MSKIAVFQVDLDGELADLEVDGETARAWILVRKAARPLGWLELAPALRRIPAAAIAAAVEASLAEERFRADALARLGPQPGAPPVSLTAAVCTRDRTDLLRRCLDSLAAQTYPGLRVLVVDNAPRREDTRQLAREQRVDYVREDRQGLDFARNRAVAACTTEVIAFLDDDAVANPGWAEAIARAFAADGELAGVTGPVVPAELETRAQLLFEEYGGFGRGFENQRFSGRGLERSYYAFCPGFCGAGCNMAFRRSWLARLGGFDESLDAGHRLPGGGDLDIFSKVLRAHGVIAYEPEALVTHRHRQDMPALRRQLYEWGRGFTAFLTARFLDDPPARLEIVRAALWWALRYQLLQRGIGRLLGRNRARIGFILLELCGGLAGPIGLVASRRFARGQAQP